MRRSKLSHRRSRKIFRRGARVHRKNALNSTSAPIMRGGIRF